MQFSISTRPRKFEDIYGQPGIVKEMIARRETHNWPQAILLKGLTGTGKTTTAQIIAMTINCRHVDDHGHPCMECPSCRSIIEERFDRDTHRLNGGASSKDEVIDFASLAEIAPMYDKSAIFIIEESDQLSTAAKNSLLKVLEQPNPNVYFILLSMVNTGLSTALQSRCQKFVFRPFSVKDIMLGLKQVLENQGLWNSPNIPKEFYLKGLATLAEASMGSFRDAVQNLEKCLVGEYWTSDLIRENLGVVDASTAYESLAKLLKLDASVLNDLEGLDLNEFFGLTYTILSQAAAYKFSRVCENEYYEDQMKGISQDKNLFDLLRVYDELQSYSFLRKALVLSKFSQYFAAKKMRRIEE